MSSIPMKSNRVHVRIVRADGSQDEWECPNLRTDAGVDWQAARMSNAVGGNMIQMAITENADAPDSGDTNLVDELGADGLSRQTATFAHTTSQSTYTLSASWQYTGASTVTVAKASVCSNLEDDDASTDSHFLMTLVSPVAVLTSDDTLSIDWGIGI